MHNQLTIPKNVVIGFRKRDDTYTNKLGFVVYRDHKGKLRQENSWDGWRDEDIDPEDYDNEPTEGFVLNKDAGGARRSYGWNARVEKVRVFDPRGWEFEIDIPNLLFILQHCSSIKGKGLEGSFLYAWSGSNIILLPTDCEEYRSSLEFTAAKTKKVTKKDMVPGCIYRTKDMVEVMYLGRYEYRGSMSIGYGWNRDGDEGKKQHIFIRTNSKNDEPSYLPLKGFTKLAERLTDEPARDFPDRLEAFLEGEHHVILDHIEFDKRVEPFEREKSYWTDDENAWYACGHIIHEELVYSVRVDSPPRERWCRIKNDYTTPTGNIGCQLNYAVRLKGEGELPVYDNDMGKSGHDIYFDTVEELEATHVNVVAVLKNGKRITLQH